MSAVYQVTVDRDRCIGAGQCVLSAEEVFDQDEAGVVVLVDTDPPRSRWDGVRLAVELCPARAVHVVDSHEGATGKRTDAEHE